MESTVECLQLRDNRKPGDAVEDNVQKALREEERSVSLSQKLLEQCIEDCQIQIKRNIQVREKLEDDWSNKCEAYRIDSHCTIMNTGERQNLQPFGIKPETNRWSSPDSWVRQTMELLDSSRREMETSRSLRSAVDQTIRAEAGQLRTKAEAVDRSLAARIREFEEVLFLLRNNSKEIVQEILKAEKLIADLKDILLALNCGPLVLTQTRLNHRNLRPSTELCYDSPQNRLQTELVELGASQRTLELELRKTEQSLAAMQEALEKVQEEARLKQESLDIDRTRCCPVRQSYPPLQKLLGY